MIGHSRQACYHAARTSALHWGFEAGALPLSHTSNPDIFLTVTISLDIKFENIVDEFAFIKANKIKT